jgi:hypothetical protein
MTTKPLWERRYERRAARRYWHMTPWRSCNRMMRGWCLRCLWRDVTGINRRAKAAYVAHVREVAATLPAVPHLRGEDVPRQRVGGSES